MGMLLDLAMKAEGGLAQRSPVTPDPATEAELRRLIDRLAEETGYFTEADKLEALEVALRDPDAWLGYLPLLLERAAAGVH